MDRLSILLDIYNRSERAVIMFGSVKKRVDETIGTNDIETEIGKNTIIKGEISGSSNIRIDGVIEGSINITGDVVIGECGRINGDITAKNLIVSGQVNGNAAIDACLKICSSGQLIGDVRVGSFKIEDGGVFKGRSEMAVKAAEQTLDFGND